MSLISMVRAWGEGGLEWGDDIRYIKVVWSYDRLAGPLFVACRQRKMASIVG
jgi:hypothetical protein